MARRKDASNNNTIGGTMKHLKTIPLMRMKIMKKVMAMMNMNEHGIGMYMIPIKQETYPVVG